MQICTDLYRLIIGCWEFNNPIKSLRLHASYDAKITKNLTPLVRFAWLFYNQIVFQKFDNQAKRTRGVSFLVITSM